MAHAKNHDYHILNPSIWPFVGAVFGEYSHRRDLEQASRVGFGPWLGFALGLAAKIAITFTMIGIFVSAYFF